MSLFTFANLIDSLFPSPYFSHLLSFYLCQGLSLLTDYLQATLPKPPTKEEHRDGQGGGGGFGGVEKDENNAPGNEESKRSQGKEVSVLRFQRGMRMRRRGRWGGRPNEQVVACHHGRLNVLIKTHPTEYKPYEALEEL